MDAEFLSEVEGFLDLCDLPTLVSTQAAHGNESSSPQAVDSNGNDHASDEAKALMTKGERVRHQVYRKRRRAERELLQQEIKELEAKLAKEPSRLLSMSGWRMVATCHLESRLVSEKRQRQLRAALAAQTTLIRTYQGLAQEELVHVTTLQRTSERETHCEPAMLRLESFDTEFYKTSEKTFNAIYAQTDEVLDAFGIDATDSKCGISIRELRDENGNMFFRYTDKRAIPTNFEQSCINLKHTLRLHQQKDQRIYDGMGDPGSTVAIKFRVTSRLKSGKVASVLLRVINRWYQEDKRMVVVWRVFGEGEGGFAGMHSDEIGWGTLTPSTERDDSSLLRLCARYVPMNFSGAVVGERDPAVKQFAGLVVNASTTNAGEIATRLEKLLLSDS
ncbi:hypothetical protein PRIC2_009752 [Phytophthora ramorum]